MQPKPLPKRLDSARLSLRALQPDWAELIYQAVDQERNRLSRFLPWPAFIQNVQDERDYIEHVNAQWGSGQLFDFALFRNEDDIYIGNAGVHSINWAHDTCELGYWLLSDYEHQGFMNEAVGALENALFAIGFHRIEIRCHAENHRSAQLPQRRGYQKEAVLRDARLMSDGYADTLVFGKLSGE